jgi:hypothetical protein
MHDSHTVWLRNFYLAKASAEYIQCNVLILTMWIYYTVGETSDYRLVQSTNKPSVPQLGTHHPTVGFQSRTDMAPAVQNIYLSQALDDKRMIRMMIIIMMMMMMMR